MAQLPVPPCARVTVPAYHIHEVETKGIPVHRVHHQFHAGRLGSHVASGVRVLHEQHFENFRLIIQLL